MTARDEPIPSRETRSAAAWRRSSRSPLPDEGPSGFSLAAAAAATFVVLYLAPICCLPILAALVPAGEHAGPLALPIFTSALRDAAAGTAVLVVLSLLLSTAERRWRFPDWLPPALSFPSAVLLVLPSALVQGGPWPAWLAFAAMIAVACCLHWVFLRWARDVWD
jgi:hypothetical protein